jgi:hypothetical protein
LQRIRERRLCHHGAEVYTQMDDGLSNLRANSADDAIGAHQPGGRHCFQQMLGYQGIDRWYTSYIDDGQIGAFCDDSFQQILHHDLSAGAV